MLQAESLLGGASHKQLTDSLRGFGWPGAAQTLAELLALDGVPEQPYRVEFGDALYIDPDGALTYVSPVTLHAIRETDTDDDGARTHAGGDANVGRRTSAMARQHASVGEENTDG